MARSIFTVVGSAVRPVLVGALVSQTLTEQAKSLVQELEAQNALRPAWTWPTSWCKA